MTAILDRLNAALAGRYVLERELGQGGMATVYLAQDARHGRRVAVKVLRPELAAAIGPDRFLREITTTAGLHHPHILPLYDSGRTGGRADGRSDDLLFYVMPYVEGESLRDRLAREKQLPVDDAVLIAREVADALSYAHAHGVVHRDIKPENILLESGHAMVADFGIARALSEAGGDRLTQTGLVIGTPTYMSPEQAGGSADVDGRSDLYSLGCVLYEMLGGEPPFTGPNVESVVRQHITAAPADVTQLRPSVPAEIAEVLRRVLAKNPADRFSPAAQFAEALRAGTGVTPARSAPARRARGPLVAGAAVVVVLLLAAAGYLLLAPRGVAPPVPGRTIQVTLDPGLELDPVLSPDGSLVAYAAGPMGSIGIYVRQVSGGGRPIPLSGPLVGDYRNPRWSPDGTRVAFEGVGGAFVAPALGGTPSLLFPRPDDFFGSLAWSPDGRQVAYVGASRIYRYTLETGVTDTVAGTYNPNALAWSPDGSRLAFVSGNGAWNSGLMFASVQCAGCTQLYFANLAPASLWTVPAAGGPPVRLTDDDHMHMSPTWLADGSLLFMSDREGSRDIYWLALNDDGGPRGPPRRLTTGLQAHSISASARGTAVAYARLDPQTNVWALPIPDRGPVGPGAAVQVTRGNQLIEAISVTADGRWLAFDSDRSGNQDIYKMELPDGEPIRLTTSPSAEFLRAWSWDGRWLGGHTIRDGYRHPFLVSADGARFELVSEQPMQERYAVPAPDGRRVLFDIEGAGGPDSRYLVVSERGPDGRWGAPRRVTDDNGREGVWSPDGRWIAHMSLGSLRLIDPETGALRVLVPFGYQGWGPAYPVWAPDGRTVYYSAADSRGRVSLWAVPAAGGTPRMLVLFDDPSRIPSRPEFAVDATRFYFTLPAHQADVWVVELGRD